MKYLLVFSLMFMVIPAYSASSGTLESVRVFMEPSGKVLILHVAFRACRANESESICFERITKDDCPKGQDGKCLPSFDMLTSSLPDRKDRNKWRAVDVNDPTRGMFVDASVILKRDVLASLENQLDVELAKPQPNTVEVIRIFRELEKKRNEPD